ncbi:MA3 domain-containing protein/MIF4G domain-containing protein [Cephalotus follicularis]|uniref:MA3 domain-containing protein/MIF4G domain-containing protein n=1 Tax=Cephalotus follicularis TaxID=3775 RepID=A0A1Q3CB30_CEPFO|nr:MA3 domain-containing protein/MIF4G domain-containing protein [Cephalotus follicularis]
MEKSRREKRKEARTEKKQIKYQSWIENQAKNSKRRFGKSQSKFISDAKKPFISSDAKKRFTQTKKEGGLGQQVAKVSNRRKIVDFRDSVGLGMEKENRDLKRNPGTNFEELLEMDAIYADDDLELERKLAKKLKLKGGMLSGDEDGFNMLFEDIPSVLDRFENEGGVQVVEEFPVKNDVNGSSSKKCKNRESMEQELECDFEDDLPVGSSEAEESIGAEVALKQVSAKAPLHKKRRKRGKNSHLDQAGNVDGGTADGPSIPGETHDAEEPSKETPAKAPGIGSSAKYVAPHLRDRAGSESQEHTQIRRRVRGLLNRLSESNVESVTGEMTIIFRSIGRAVGTQIISEEVLASCSTGPRGNEQYAAVFAAFIAGMACSVGMDFSAKLMALLAKTFEDEYLKEDDLSLRNITLLLSYLCTLGVFSSDLIYDFLIMLSKQLTEITVSTILTVLQCCGMKIRGEDPAAMKKFILCIQDRVNELKASGNTNINSKRMEFMLETICDIKNNKKRPKEDTAQHTRIKKWLQKLRVEDILIRGLTWSKLLDPDKKGQWWLSGDISATIGNVEDVASTIDKEVLEAQKMLHLAAAQRMNTDIRKAIFCIIMTGEDYIDAFEKLLRLDLQGQQDREIIRVLVQCCLQEKVFNKYYTVLASKLCEHDKNQKFTLQFCLWDHFKELESMQLLRSMHLAKFVAEMVASFSLSLGILKTIDFSDPRQLTPKRIIHFRMLFEAIFEYPENLIWNMFSRLAVIPELETLRDGIEFFLKEHVVKTDKTLGKKFKLAKKALKNAGGVLM